MKRVIYMLAVAVAAMVLGSCSKKGDLLSKVPADVEQVGVVKLKSLLENAGCRFEDGKFNPPAGLDNFGDNDLFNILAKLDYEGVVELNQMVYAVRGGKGYLLIPIDSEQKFAEATKESVEWSESAGGFMTGTGGGDEYVVGDGIFWTIPKGLSQDPVGDVKAFLKSAEKSSIESLEGVRESLLADNMLNMTFSVGSTDKKAQTADSKNTARWISANFIFNENKLLVDLGYMEADGTPVDIPGLKPVNPAVLSYIPGDMMFAMALGITPEFRWDILSKMVNKTHNFGAISLFSMAMPYLSSIDGTLMVAAKPLTEGEPTSPDLDTWQVVAMVHLSQEKINEIMDTLRTMLFTAGVIPEMTDNGLLRIRNITNSFYIGNVDGYLAFSNFPIQSGCQNSLSPVFEGKNGACVLNLPTLRIIDDNFPAVGAQVNLQCEPSGGRIEATFASNEASAAEILLKMMMAL